MRALAVLLIALMLSVPLMVGAVGDATAGAITSCCS